MSYNPIPGLEDGPCETSVVRHDAQPSHALTPASHFDAMALMDRAIAGGAGIEVVERLVALFDKQKAEAARERFDAAMADFQAECPQIVKQKVIDGRVKYAPIEHIDAICKPLWQKHGFSHTFDTDLASKPGHVTIVCNVSGHGHTRSSTVKDFPLPDRSKMMSNASQQFGGGMTYAKRYALTSAYGIVIAGEDNDGASRQKPQAPAAVDAADPEWDALRKTLWSLLEPVRGTAKNWVAANQWLYDNEILDGGVPEEAPRLSVARFKTVIAEVKKVLK